jgi:two-component system, HptB-dependent secretion and biofilm response regulator
MTPAIRRRVLVIAADPAIADALHAHDVMVATTAAEALAFEPELVVLDYAPAAQHAMAELRGAGLRAPILLLSGAGEIERWAEWGTHPADDFLIKPFAPERLLAKAERLLQIFAIEERNEIEAEAARKLLDKMVQRGHFDPLRVKVESLSAGTFGGDVVLARDLGDGRYRWLLGDVTGHTLASALVTIPISMMFYTSTSKHVPLREVVESIDQELGVLLPVTMFLAAIACELDRVRGTLTVINAGCPDVLVRHAGAPFEAIASTSPPLGAIRDVGWQAEPVTCKVSRGDRIYAMTDGLLDVRGDDGALFGMEGVRAALEGAALDDGFAALTSAWRAHAGAHALDDDLSIIEVAV